MSYVISFQSQELLVGWSRFTHGWIFCEV